MARKGKLSARGVASLTAPGRYYDGDGLHLFIDSAGRRYWVLRYMRAGRQRDMSLGPERRMSLADARRAAAKALEGLRDGVDPIMARRAEAPAALSFADAARRVHAMRRQMWRNGKHQAQWLSTLETHAFPLIGDRPVAEVTRAEVLGVLEPIWLVVPETARRVKQRIGAVIDWAVGAGLRAHGVEMHLVSRALPRQPARDGHLPALRAADVPGFLRALGHSPARPKVRVALELLVLTASRPGNIRRMRWEDVDLAQAIWTRPAEQMKAGRAHRVPLCARAVGLLQDLAPVVPAPDGLVFPGAGGGMLSENTLNKAVRTLGFEATSHGFRASFKEWSLSAGWPDHLSEAQLAHADPNKARAAYAREDLLEERRPMMEAWSRFVRDVE
ncbi:MAG: integrase arm-type DNA-binding domain-containing protein [Sphingomonadaceae bacterium]